MNVCAQWEEWATTPGTELSLWNWHVTGQNLKRDNSQMDMWLQRGDGGGITLNNIISVFIIYKYFCLWYLRHITTHQTREDSIPLRVHSGGNERFEWISRVMFGLLSRIAVLAHETRMASEKFHYLSISTVCARFGRINIYIFASLCFISKFVFFFLFFFWFSS